MSFTFNVGYRFDQSFRYGIDNSNTAMVIARMSKYIYGGGRILPGLVSRRKSETKLYKYAILIYY